MTHLATIAIERSSPLRLLSFEISLHEPLFFVPAQLRERFGKRRVAEEVGAMDNVLGYFF